jgi:hypothetical protein
MSPFQDAAAERMLDGWTVLQGRHGLQVLRVIGLS